MNERIRALLEKSTKKIKPDDRVWVFSEVDQEKFAELIVRECIDIAKDVNRNPYLHDEDQARQIIKNITKRFGVAE